MIDKIISDEKINILAMHNIYNPITKSPNLTLHNCFTEAIKIAEKSFINNFYKSCDDIGIAYDIQEKILNNIKNYIN